MSYQYSPLDQSTQEIRLLELQPDPTVSSPIRCTLRHTNLLDEPRYTALSYVWGEPNLFCSILLDEKRKEVTPNLEDALRHIRQADASVTLWVDALCINQSDDSERSHQIAQMAQVYSGAAQTILWMGPARKNNHLAMEFLNDLPNIYKGSLDYFRNLPSDPTGQVLSSTSEHSHNPEVLWSAEYLQHWAELKTLVGLPCWGRLWIVQEVVLSQNCILMWGNLQASWSQLVHLFDFKNVSLLPHQSPRVTVKVLHFPSGPQSLASLKNDRGNAVPLDLLRCLITTRSHGASDPRDKVFGVLGLCQSAGFKPDYSKPVSQVYQDISRHIIESRRDLDLLSACRSRGEYFRPANNTVSWVPDWDDCILHVKYLLFYNYECRFKAGGNHPVKVSFVYEHILRSAGLLVDDIASTPSNMAYCETGLDTKSPFDAALEHFWNSWHGYISQEHITGLYGRDEDKRRAFIQTVSSGNPYLRQGDSRMTALEFATLATEQFFTGLERGRGRVRELDKISQRYRENTIFNRFFITRTGRMGVGPEGSQKGDLVVILFGAKVPFVLRRAGSNTYRLVGECYVHGIMDGEVVEEYEKGGVTPEEFDIV